MNQCGQIEENILSVHSLTLHQVSSRTKKVFENVLGSFAEEQCCCTGLLKLIVRRKRPPAFPS